MILFIDRNTISSFKSSQFDAAQTTSKPVTNYSPVHNFTRHGSAIGDMNLYLHK